MSQRFCVNGCRVTAGALQEVRSIVMNNFSRCFNKSLACLSSRQLHTSKKCSRQVTDLPAEG